MFKSPETHINVRWAWQPAWDSGLRRQRWGIDSKLWPERLAILMVSLILAGIFYLREQGGRGRKMILN